MELSWVEQSEHFILARNVLVRFVPPGIKSGSITGNHRPSSQLLVNDAMMMRWWCEWCWGHDVWKRTEERRRVFGCFSVFTGSSPLRVILYHLAFTTICIVLRDGYLFVKFVREYSIPIHRIHCAATTLEVPGLNKTMVPLKWNTTMLLYSITISGTRNFVNLK